MLEDVIIDDLFDSHRTFLPGKRCTRDGVVAHLQRAVLLDGLDREESRLILSTLPEKADRIYLTPLDKGLSGSKVFSAKFDAEGKRVSKLFVFKLGNKHKIDIEHDAIERFVSPHINGVGQPVYRTGEEKALLAQEFVGLGSNTSLQSLKSFIRKSKHPESTLSRLLNERLGNWYQGDKNKTFHQHNLGSLFKWYLSKVGISIYPPDWVELQNWVRSVSGHAWEDVDDVVEYLKCISITSRSTTVHGDLHSQNILIDEREECWPIDFAWCHDNASPILDFTMLECSLKFLAIPQRSDLFTLIRLEERLASEPFPKFDMGLVPYSSEITNVVCGIVALRRFAIDTMGITFEDYRKSLCLMTYAHSTHPMLNLPYILASLQILAALERH